ncbi:MAG: histidine kinase [Bryobacteraceae bacterium]|jgi:signal transduction histidine kinase
MTTRKTYWACQVLGWGCYSAAGLAGASRQIGWRPTVAVGYLLFGLYSIALTELFRREILRRGWLNADAGRMFRALAPGVVTVGSIQSFLVIAINQALEPSSNTFVREPGAALWLWVSVIGATSIWTILYVALTAQRRSREKEVHLQLAISEAELRALEAQINPHFLFNCLNSIRGLVVENPALAQDMITRFANILRYNLHRDPNHTVPLASEVEVVSDYLVLESVRLEERLQVRMAIEPGAAEVPIPPMLLQSLVENAVKHGIAPLPAGGELVVSARLDGDALVVEVDSPGHVADANPDASGLGLANTRERLRILYGSRASLRLENRDGRVAATVRVPRTA